MAGATKKSNPIAFITLVIGAIVVIVAWKVFHGRLIFAGIFWATVAVVFIVAFVFRPKRRKGDGAVKPEQIAAMQQQGVALHHEKEMPLESRDVSKVMKMIRQALTIVPVCSVIGFLIVHFLIGDGILPYAILLLFIVITLIAILKGVKVFRKILQNNTKIVVRGIVTEHWEVSQGSGEDKKVTYYVRIGDRQLCVDEEFYNEFLKGDAVEVHFAEVNKTSPFIFHTERIAISQHQPL